LTQAYMQSTLNALKYHLENSFDQFLKVIFRCMKDYFGQITNPYLVIYRGDNE
jgi:hypothetical protein